MSKGLDLENIREYDINLSKPEDNPNGFVIHQLARLAYGNELIEAITLTKYVPDMKDMLGTDKISVTLMDCGTKFYVQEPALSRFLETKIDETFAGFADQKGLRNGVRTAHEMLVCDIHLDPNRKTKKYTLQLPKGIKCKLGYMNPYTGGVLNGVMSMSTTTLDTSLTAFANDLDCIHLTVTWVAVLDKEIRLTRKPPERDVEFTNLFTRLNVGTSPSRTNNVGGTTSTSRGPRSGTDGTAGGGTETGTPSRASSSVVDRTPSVAARGVGGTPSRVVGRTSSRIAVRNDVAGASDRGEIESAMDTDTVATAAPRTGKRARRSAGIAP